MEAESLHIAPSSGATVSLDTWAERDCNDGIQIDSCSALDRIVVRTLNNVYEVIVLDGGAGEVMIRGGRFFPEFSRARLAGATAGGKVKSLGIYVGLRMELYVDDQPIVTSKVRRISRWPATSS